MVLSLEAWGRFEMVLNWEGLNLGFELQFGMALNSEE